MLALAERKPDAAAPRPAPRPAAPERAVGAPSFRLSLQRAPSSSPRGGGCTHCEQAARSAGAREAGGRGGREDVGSARAGETGVDGDASVSVPASVRGVVASPGERLEPSTRAYFEMRFGRDLGDVRVHRDGPAAESARHVQANAYTAGQHVVFAAGRYAPETAEGRGLLAHELAHTVQNRGRGEDGAIQREPAEPRDDKDPLAPMDNEVIPLMLQARCLTNTDGMERCGNLILKADGTFRNTGLTKGGEKTCKAGGTVKQGEKWVAYYHSHPRDANGGNPKLDANNRFTEDDKSDANAKKIYYYLVNPINEVLRYTPSQEVGRDGLTHTVKTFDPLKCP